MMHRTLRAVAMALMAPGILLAGFPGSGPAHAATTDLTINFEDIESYVRAASPQARIIAQEMAAVRAARDQALQWSNPAVAYDREIHDEAGEWQFTLHKRFERPFKQSQARAGWQGQVQAADLQGAQAAADFLTMLKAGYVRLQLYNNYRARLGKMTQLVEMAAEVAASRHAEGELSGIEKQLVQLTAYSVDAISRRVGQEHRQTAAGWRAEMGLAAAGDLQLVTPVGYQPVALLDTETYMAFLEERPGTKSLATLAESLGLQVAAAKPGFIPAFNVYGGYKHFAGDENGYVAGVALDLPLFDRQKGAARQLEARRVIVQNELALRRTGAASEVAALVEVITVAQPPLATFATELAGNAALGDALLLAYQEGSLSLDALLGAIQIESLALENYYDELVGYYRNLFRLEALTGVSLVHFASEEN